MAIVATFCGRGPAARPIAAAAYRKIKQVLNSFTLNLYFSVKGWI
jgi:hypothetical protein